jgi:1-acyl-sn-glycerol-3-phosphate acyltransferase
MDAPAPAAPAPRPAQLLTLLRLAAHLARGLATAALIFPFCSPRTRDALIRAWSRSVLAILRVRLTVHGPVPAAGAPCVVVANHISWLDVWLIDSQRACHFVAKSEVRDWPVVGWLAQKSGTLFIQRARRHHTAALNQEMIHALGEGACVAVFPEGTTSDGRQLRRFFTSLLQPAADTGAPLIPVAIRYTGRDGEADLTPAFIDDMTLTESLRRVLAAREIRAELSFLPPVDTRGKTRRDIAHAAEHAIAAALRLPSPGTTPETAPGPRDA